MKNTSIEPDTHKEEMFQLSNNPLRNNYAQNILSTPSRMRRNDKTYKLTTVCLPNAKGSQKGCTKDMPFI